MKTLILLLAALLTITACSTVHVSKGDIVFERTSFGTDIQLPALQFTERHGFGNMSTSTVIFSMSGLDQNQSSTIGAATAAAVSAAIKSAKTP